jgi:hypothetical protein
MALPADTATQQALSRLITEANASDVAFQKAVDTDAASISAGQGAPQGSDAWVSAQVRLAALERSRAKTMSSLAEVDKLLLDRLDQGGNGTVELRAAQSVIAAMANAQAARLDALKRR